MLKTRARTSAVRWAAIASWTALGAIASLGCIPISVATVEQNYTTGEKLRALSDVAQDAARTAGASKVRAQLLGSPPNLAAQVDQPLDDYSIFSPGLYAPMDQERSDLRKARDAGVISAAEFEELNSLLDAQGTRPVVRRGFEIVGHAALHSSMNGPFGGMSEPYSKSEAARRIQIWADDITVNAQHGSRVWNPNSWDDRSGSFGYDWSFWMIPGLPTPTKDKP